MQRFAVINKHSEHYQPIICEKMSSKIEKE